MSSEYENCRRWIYCNPSRARMFCVRALHVGYIFFVIALQERVWKIYFLTNVERLCLSLGKMNLRPRSSQSPQRTREIERKQDCEPLQINNQLLRWCSLYRYIIYRLSCQEVRLHFQTFTPRVVNSLSFQRNNLKLEVVISTPADWYIVK
jgi:hypothetical protein